MLTAHIESSNFAGHATTLVEIVSVSNLEASIWAFFCTLT